MLMKRTPSGQCIFPTVALHLLLAAVIDLKVSLSCSVGKHNVVDRAANTFEQARATESKRVHRLEVSTPGCCCLSIDLQAYL